MADPFQRQTRVRSLIHLRDGKPDPVVDGMLGKMDWWLRRIKEIVTKAGGFDRLNGGEIKEIGACYDKVQEAAEAAAPYLRPKLRHMVMDGTVSHRHDLTQLSDDDLAAIESILGKSAVISGDQSGTGETSH